MRPVDVAKRRKKGQKTFMRKLSIYSDHPRRRSSLKFCMHGHDREIVIYFMFHEHRSSGFGAVGGQKSLFSH